MGLAGGWSERPLPAGAVTFAPRRRRSRLRTRPRTRSPATAPPPSASPADLLAAGATVLRTPRSGELAVTGTLPADLLARAGARGVALTAAGVPPANAVALRAPKVALLADLAPVVPGRAGLENSTQHEPHAWMRFVLAQRLGLPADVLGDADLAAGRLRDGGYTALVVAGTRIPDGALGAAVLAEVRAFVAAGGTYVGVRPPRAGRRPRRRADDGGRALRAHARRARRDVRRRRRPRRPRRLGQRRGPRGFAFDAGDPVLEAGDAHPVLRYARSGGLVSGYARDAAVLAGTPAVLDATLGAGRVVLFGRPELPGLRRGRSAPAGQRAPGAPLPPLPSAVARTRRGSSRCR